MINLKIDIFPINYFKSVGTPTRAFKNRHKLNWLQLIIVLFFLNGLMTIPVTLNYTNLNFIPLEEFYPNAIQIIDEKSIQVIQDSKFDSGQMFIESPFIIENEYGIAAGGIESNFEEELLQAENYIFFEENQFLIKEAGTP